jgi:hypothetical protein
VRRGPSRRAAPGSSAAQDGRPRRRPRRRFIVSARTGGDVDDPAGVALFLVSRGEPGVEVKPYPTQDGAAAAELVLNGATAIELLPAGEAMPALERAVDIGIARSAPRPWARWTRWSR